jgi:hypothetical protein
MRNDLPKEVREWLEVICERLNNYSVEPTTQAKRTGE